MGCYNCGSSDGTDTKLCPRCAESRARHRTTPYQEQNYSPKPESKFIQYFLGGIVTLCVTAFAGYHLHKDAQFRSLPIHERFYQKCLKKFEEDAARAERNLRRQQKSCSDDNFHITGASPEFLRVFHSYSDVPTGFKEATLAEGRNFCLTTRNQCELDPKVCECPILKSRFHY